MQLVRVFLRASPRPSLSSGGCGWDGGVSGMLRAPTLHLDITEMQEEIDRVRENAAAAAAKETLRKIFPSMDVEVVEWVLEANGVDVGRSVEALLEMIGGG
jgi:hypothetical protein